MTRVQLFPYTQISPTSVIQPSFYHCWSHHLQLNHTRAPPSVVPIHSNFTYFCYPTLILPLLVSPPTVKSYRGAVHAGISPPCQAFKFPALIFQPFINFHFCLFSVKLYNYINCINNLNKPNDTLPISFCGTFHPLSNSQFHLQYIFTLYNFTK